MKALKTILFVFLLFNGYLAYAQKANASRTETESWLLQKLNTNINSYTLNCINPVNIPELSVCFTHTNIIFSISGDNLIINANTKRHEKGKDENYKTKWTIPLYAISNKNICLTDITFSCGYRAISEKLTTGMEYKISSVKFQFNPSNEENLWERINKAFKHLLTFIKKPKSVEPF